MTQELSSAFSELDSRLFKALEKLKFSAETEIQTQAIPIILDGHDLMASSDTGSGKTAAFLLPIMQYFLGNPAPRSATRALILAPTRELARQIDKQVTLLGQFTGIQSGLITGGESFKFQSALLRKNPEIVVGTPGRILEHCQRGSLELQDLEFFVLDEADKILEFGFNDDVLTISEFCRKERQSLMFSATLRQGSLKSISDKILNNPKQVHLSQFQQLQEQITQQIITADDLKHKENLTARLLQQRQYRKAVVFCNTKAQVDRMGGLLRYHDIATGTLHGDLDQDTRKRLMEQFRDNKYNVLVASDVAARGIDVREIDLVINFDMAHNAEDYIHRVGRTGRAGATGTAVSLISHREWNLMATIERFLKIKFEMVQVKGLIGRYLGPKNLKSNGKAAGAKKRNAAKKANMTSRDKKRLAKKLDKKQQKKNSNSADNPWKSTSTDSSTESSSKPKKFGAIAEGGLKPLRKRNVSTDD